MTCWKLKHRLVECIRNKGEVDLMYFETTPSGGSLNNELTNR